LLGYEKSPISTAMIAILLGMVFGNIFQMRNNFVKGLEFTQSYILKLGIICLGIQLKPFEFIEFGAIAIPLIIICIVAVLIVIKILIKKLKIPTRMAYLISIGSTVCRTTAIMATAPVIGAKKMKYLMQSLTSHCLEFYQCSYTLILPTIILMLSQCLLVYFWGHQFMKHLK